MLGGPLADRIGRRGAVRAAMLPVAAGYLVIATAGRPLELFAGRLLTGIGAGVVSVATPMYLTEIAPPAVRGALGSSFQLAVVTGLLLAYLAGALLVADHGWRVVATVGALPAAGERRSAMLLLATAAAPPTPAAPPLPPPPRCCPVATKLTAPLARPPPPPGLLLAAGLLPESPRWLATREGRLEDAEATTIWLSGSQAEKASSLPLRRQQVKTPTLHYEF